MTSEDDVRAYHELSAYTLAHGGAAFIHQHVVDAFAAQHADDRSQPISVTVALVDDEDRRKPIGVTFALVGLFLHVELRWTGRQVQRAHVQLARQKRPW